MYAKIIFFLGPSSRPFYVEEVLCCFVSTFPTGGSSLRCTTNFFFYFKPASSSAARCLRMAVFFTSNQLPPAQLDACEWQPTPQWPTVLTPDRDASYCT